MKLHVFPPSPRATKVMALANHLGLDCEIRVVNLFKGEQLLASSTTRARLRHCGPGTEVPGRSLRPPRRLADHAARFSLRSFGTPTSGRGVAAYNLRR